MKAVSGLSQGQGVAGPDATGSGATGSGATGLDATGHGAPGPAAVGDGAVGVGDGADVEGALSADGWSPGVRIVRRDAKTGRHLIQLSDGPATTHHPYVYCRAFDEGESSVVLSSDRTGRFELHQVNIETGDTRQLTNLPDLAHLGHAVSPSGREAVFVAGARLMAVSLADRSTRVIADLSDHAAPRGVDHRVAVSADESLAYVWFTNRQGRASIARTRFRPDPGPDASGSGRPLEPGNATSGNGPAGNEVEIVVTFEHMARITHLRVCPADPNLLSYNPVPDRQDDATLPPEQRARVWIYNVATRVHRPLLIAPPGMRATHEYWSHDGRRLYGHFKTVGSWTPTSVVSVDADGGDLQVHHRSDEKLLGHSSVSPDGSMMVIDNQQPRSNELTLVDLRSGRASVLCWPDASGRPHPNHVHPMFSPSGRYVLYTSDSSGSAQVFLVDLRDGPQTV